MITIGNDKMLGQKVDDRWLRERDPEAYEEHLAKLEENDKKRQPEDPCTVTFP